MKPFSRPVHGAICFQLSHMLYFADNLSSTARSPGMTSLRVHARERRWRTPSLTKCNCLCQAPFCLKAAERTWRRKSRHTNWKRQTGTPLLEATVENAWALFSMDDLTCWKNTQDKNRVAERFSSLRTVRWGPIMPVWRRVTEYGVLALDVEVWFLLLASPLSSETELLCSFFHELGIQLPLDLRRFITRNSCELN